MGIRATYRPVLPEHLPLTDEATIAAYCHSPLIDAAALSRMEGYGMPAELLAEMRAAHARAAELPAACGIDKAWDALHRLLASDAVLAIAVLGKHPVGPDLSYGPAQLLTPDEVAAIADAWPRAEPLVRAAWASEGPGDAYPDVWDEPDVLDSYLLPRLSNLGRVFAAAAGEGCGVLAWLS